MNTTKLKTFAQKARKVLIEETTKKLDYIMHSSTPEALEQKKILLKYGFGERGISTERQIRGSEQTKAEQIEKIAYTWFNRLCALRYMDMKGYTDCGIITEKEGFTQPEILTEAKNGTLPANLERHTDMQILQAILSGRTGVANRDEAAYRVLLKGACNYYHTIMPFMFEPINDYTEILLMDDCLSENSLLADLKEAMDEENCQNVEVIGWLYQHYISEKKDTVFEQVKKQRRKVKETEIPAVTQLFTPHWIVRYLVENTLGRLWMLNHPQSNLKEHMAFYIEPEADESYIPIQSVEDIRICDPACGSGHMLTYTFDLLFHIYEEELYTPKDAVEAILNKNLKGLEVDERAGELAQFALFMKARDKYKRFFKKSHTPKIHVFDNILVSEEELTDFESQYGIINTDFKELIAQMTHAKSFGSLINPQGADITSEKEALLQFEAKDMMHYHVKQRLVRICEHLEALNQTYHVVVTNPPYLGNFDKEMGKFMEKQYKDYKSDTFAAFMVRNALLTKEKGFMGFMTPYVWMFISSYEKLRKYLVENTPIYSLVQLEYNSLAVAMVPACTFLLQNNRKLDQKGVY